MANQRNRVLYQSEAMFVGDITGDDGNREAGHINAVTEQVIRVQDISHDMDVNRTDIFEFGQLAPITRQVIEPPTVSLDFSYYLADGDNEHNMGFVLADGTRVGPTAANHPNAISGLLDDDAKKEKNYYVVTTPEFTDAHGNSTTASDLTDAKVKSKAVVGFGNGALSNYTVNAAVGDLPTASVTVEAYNLAFLEPQDAQVTTNWFKVNLPSVDKETNQLAEGFADIPYSNTGTAEVFAVRPGDIEVIFKPADATTDLISDQAPQIGGAILPSGDPDAAGTKAGETPMHIQNFSIEVPLARTPLQRIGSTFPYDRAVDFPLDMTFNCSALLADIQTGTLLNLMCNDQDKRDIVINCNFPCGRTAGDKAAELGSKNLSYTIKNAYLQSQNFSNSIGDNKTVDFSWTAQFGGVNDTSNGLFMSGVGGTAV